MEGAGRWTVLEAPERDGSEIEAVAWGLLRRWGVVFRALLERESALPRWIDLLRCFRRLEARGEIRGGRFVAGFSGEQFALPEAVGALRDRRKPEDDAELLSLSAADPLNLLGVVLPGPRLAAIASNRLLLRGGVVLAVKDGGEIRFLQEAPTPASRWEWETAVVRSEVPAPVRAYLERR